MVSTPDSTRRLDILANEVLTLIEGRELRALTWGFTEIKVDLDAELPSLLGELPTHFFEEWEELKIAGASEQTIIDNLVDRRLVFRSGNRYRSRFAETVRLLALLRQRFKYDDWSTASTLVGDYRLFVERRSYPVRNIPAEELVHELKSTGTPSLQIEAVQALLQPEDSAPLLLARFQKDAILRTLRNLRTWGERGVVVGASTGAGKTKAFYIPAMATIAATDEEQRRSPQVVALYPRNELLKDQLVEALSEARKLDTALINRKCKPISVGAYYGDTPFSAIALKDQKFNGWNFNTAHDGWECPSVRCPNDACGRETLIWRRADVDQEIKAARNGKFGSHEILVCPDCGYRSPVGAIKLTRDSMTKSPPDILFTTTEMLNRQLANPISHRLFGIGGVHPPQLLLLDEVHTYSGIHGAQVAYLLRRWRHARKLKRDAPLCVVGLSATLTQAERFFSELTGLPQHTITYVAPQSEDLIQEGAEYNMVMKGDPASTAALLSTSVQTNMLIARMLDLPSRLDSRGAFGTKIFAFSDNLDTINRWYHVELDAEKQSRNAPLSKYRAPNDYWTKDEKQRRDDAGQVWWASKCLGHDLNTGLKLERTSSQDRGVKRSAQLVIATSTLEVGFNDPTVGAVVQHKAPRNMASFLQRKGRAGRVRTMRPWTIVVTSGFGRDRWAFQHAEQLFQPTIPPINLPLDNDYVRKIQAAYVLMDWLASKVGLNVWDLLTNKRRNSAGTQSGRRRIVEILDGVLLGIGTARDNLLSYLAAALGLDPSSREMDDILWQDPRPLMFEVIPSIVRQLKSIWHGEQDDIPSDQPLPSYVPKSLFSDLNLPELQVKIPETTFRTGGARPAYTENMPLAEGLRNFAPGHVSKRFTVRNARWVAHWLKENPSTTGKDRTVFELDGSDIAIPSEPLVTIPAQTDAPLPIYRPRAIQLSQTPDDVEPTSTGRLVWSVRMLTKEGLPSTTLGLREASPLRQFIESIEYFLHDESKWATVVRYAHEIEVQRKVKRKKSSAWTLTFQRHGQPAAIGFSVETDAIRFRLQPFDATTVMTSPNWATLYGGLAPQFFRDLLLQDPELKEEALNFFDIDWIWQIEVAALTATASARQTTLEEAANELDRSRMAFVTRTMKAIFQTQRTEAGEEVEEYGRRFDALLELEERPAVVRALQKYRRVLWDDSHHDFLPWLEQRHYSSVATALYSALTRFVPNIDPDDLLFDVENGEVWFSESVPGGIGIVSQIVREIYERPREFDLAFIDAIEFCDREHLASQLQRVSTLLDQTAHPLVTLFSNIRRGGDIRTIESLKDELTEKLEREGVSVDRSLLVALNTKYLRPNSGPDSDAVVSELVRLWEEEQRRLGLQIDLRTISVAATQHPSLEDRLAHLLQRIDPTSVHSSTSQATSENRIFNLLQSLLWEGCHDSCPQCIRVSTTFFDPGFVSRRLLREQLDLSLTQIRYGVSGWEEEMRDHLRRHLEVRVSCDEAERNACASDLLDALVEPLDLDYQLTHASIQGVSREGTRWVIHIVVPDLVSR